MSEVRPALLTKEGNPSPSVFPLWDPNAGVRDDGGGEQVEEGDMFSNSKEGGGGEEDASRLERRRDFNFSSRSISYTVFFLPVGLPPIVGMSLGVLVFLADASSQEEEGETWLSSATT